ncbi:MAG: putative phage tail protein [Rhodobacteraceae bacterium HLUCCO18]|nr:MAG: putative phage tail protein [Rhodobacteraceae bacterium HLUCCO18]
MAVPPEEAERRCRRALMEAWVGRETAGFRLPPSRLALDPADAIRLAHDGRLVDLRLVSIADAEGRGIEAVRQDRATYDLPPGDPRAASLTRAVVFGAPDAVLMDLPQLTEDQPAHRPLVAAHAVPWPGEMAVFRSPSTDGFELLTTFGSRARTGVLVSDFYAGPTSRFDLGNALVVDLLTGTLESVTDLTLFGGANALAIESAPGVWEIVQAGAAELLAPGRYRLTRLLRGQRGTEGAIGNPAPAGARVVVLDTALASLPIAEADLGIPWNWRIGPASRPVSDETYMAQAFAPAGVGLRPFSVADGPAEHVRGAVGRVCRKPFGRQAEAIPRARDPRARDHRPRGANLRRADRPGGLYIEDHAVVRVDEVVVGVCEERRALSGAGPLAGRIGEGGELRLDLARRPEGGIVEHLKILAHSTGRRLSIDPDRVPVGLGCCVLLVSVRPDQTGIPGEGLTTNHALGDRIPKAWPTISIRIISSGSTAGRPVEL